MALSDRSMAFLAAGLLIALPTVTLLVMKGTSQKSATPVFMPRESATMPEEILLKQLETLKPGEDKKALTLRTNLGHILRAAGKYGAALEQYKLARDMAMRVGEGEQLGELQGMLGNAYYHHGRLSDARRELEAGVLLVDPHGANVFDILRALGNVKRDQGHYDAALELYEKIRNDREMRRVISADAMAGLHNDLGELYQRKGDSGKALMYYHQALDQQASFDELITDSREADVELASTHNHIGQALHDAGNIQKAMEEYGVALKIQEQALRKGHPVIAATLMNMARAQRDMGSQEKSLEVLAKAEKGLQLSDEDIENIPEYGSILSMKADVLREQQKYAEAEEAALKALAIEERAFGSEGNPEIAVTLNGLGSVYHDQNRYDLALKQYLRALDINQRTVGTKNPETAATYNNIGNVYQDAGDDENAKKYYQLCLDIQLATIGEKNPDLGASYNNIASILFRQRQFAEAQELFEKALEVAKAAGLPKGNPDRAIYEDNIVLLREEMAKQAAKKEGQATPAEETEAPFETAVRAEPEPEPLEQEEASQVDEDPMVMTADA